MQRIGIGKAHAKIIMIGEHAVVYGYPAIAVPLPSIELTCTVRPSNERFVKQSDDPLSTAISAALASLNRSEAKITYEVTSSIPQMCGMGSSAAVAIAAIRAVYDFFDTPIDDRELEIIVNQAEIVAHVKPSGLDAKTCLSNTAIRLIRNVEFSALEISLGAYLVIADTGLHGQTRQAVQKVADQAESSEPHLRKLGLLAERLEEALDRRDAAHVGRLMSKAHDELRQLGVSCPQSDHLVNAALQYGALGAKMSGGGLGGCIVALVNSEQQAAVLSEVLRREGAVETWIERL